MKRKNIMEHLPNMILQFLYIEIFMKYFKKILWIIESIKKTSQPEI